MYCRERKPSSGGALSPPRFQLHRWHHSLSPSSTGISALQSGQVLAPVISQPSQSPRLLSFDANTRRRRKLAATGSMASFKALAIARENLSYIEELSGVG